MQVAGEPEPQANGAVHPFDQDAFLDDGADARMSKTGYVYVPARCRDSSCGLHLAFHGCLQSAESIGMEFVEHAGYNRWADLAGVVVIYPQTRSSLMPLNQLGLENKEVLTAAKALGIAAAKVPSSSLDKITAEYLEEEILKTHPALAAKLKPASAIPPEPKPVHVEQKIEIIKAPEPPPVIVAPEPEPVVAIAAEPISETLVESVASEPVAEISPAAPVEPPAPVAPPKPIVPPKPDLKTPIF